jgi:AraC-like DNA-binding protein
MATTSQCGNAGLFAGKSSRWDMQFSTRSVDEAVSAVERLYGPHELVLYPRRVLNLQFGGFDVGRLSVSHIAYGCPALARPERPNEYWMFSYIVRGEARAAGQTVGTAMASVRAPGTMTDIPMSAELQLMNLKVEQADLLEARATLLGYESDDPIGFIDCMPAGSPPAVRMTSLLQRLQNLPPCPAPFRPLLERRWQEATLLELLLTLPLSSPLHLDRNAAQRGAVDRAMDMIHADPAASITLGDLARTAGVGVRALTRGFEQRLGISPMRYLQQRRLERARSDLLDGCGNVTSVAYRWGFGNLGDFSLTYRERFGERPSETLRSARARRR